MDQKGLFPVGGETLVRTEDPETSHEAADALRGSDRLGDLQELALVLVRANPGATANELARIQGGIDSRRIPRRLRELERRGRIYVQGTKTDSLTGRSCLRWWPTLEK